MCIYSKHSTWHIYEADDKKRRERIASMIFKKYISFKHLKLECRKKKTTVKKLYFNNIYFLITIRLNSGKETYNVQNKITLHHIKNL